MPTYIIKLTDEKDNTDYYMEWSTVVDAPITYGLSLEEFKEYYQTQYGTAGMRDLGYRMERVEEKGTSALPPFDNMDEVLKHNRAGEGETCLDKEGLLERYCRSKS
jgi:hypothetical protein